MVSDFTPGTSHLTAIISFAHTLPCHLSDVYLALHHSFAPASVTIANNSYSTGAASEQCEYRYHYASGK